MNVARSWLGRRSKSPSSNDEAGRIGLVAEELMQVREEIRGGVSKRGVLRAPNWQPASRKAWILHATARGVFLSTFLSTSVSRTTTPCTYVTKRILPACLQFTTHLEHQSLQDGIKVRRRPVQKHSGGDVHGERRDQQCHPTHAGLQFGRAGRHCPGLATKLCHCHHHYPGHHRESHVRVGRTKVLHHKEP